MRPNLKWRKTNNMNMRAKFVVRKVETFEQSENITFAAVSSKPFDKDGNSEDNSFARWTPNGSLTMTITNPNLRGTIKEGENYYLDFTKSE